MLFTLRGMLNPYIYVSFSVAWTHFSKTLGLSLLTLPNEDKGELLMSWRNLHVMVNITHSFFLLESNGAYVEKVLPRFSLA